MVRAMAAAVALAIVASGCGGDDPVGGPPTSTTGAPVEIPDQALDFTGQDEVTVITRDNVFEQRIIVIDPGTTVTWVNRGASPHNVKPAVEGTFRSIDTGDLDRDESGARTFDTAGDYPYFCSLHGTARQGQTGRIIVVGG